MEAEPHFSAPAQGVGAALGRGEEGAAHGGVPGARHPVWEAARRPQAAVCPCPPSRLAGRPASAPCRHRTPRHPCPRGTRRDAACGTDLGTHGLDAGTVRDASALHTGWRRGEPSRVSQVPRPRWLAPPRGAVVEGRSAASQRPQREAGASCSAVSSGADGAWSPGRDTTEDSRQETCHWSVTFPGCQWHCRPAGVHGPFHTPGLTNPASFSIIFPE